MQRSSNDYLYDVNGNQTRDPHKGITTEFNYLNQPYLVTWDNGNTIEWQRDATGQKLQRTSKRNAVVESKLDYLGSNFEYQNDTLDRIYLENAKLTFDKGNFQSYQFFHKDHLMSTRVVFEDGGSGVAALISEAHSYPFGLAFDGDFTVNNKVKRLYNFKEQVQDFGLGWMDFGARYYTNGAVPVFVGVDPIASDYPYVSPFNYAENEPVANIDLWGLQQQSAVKEAEFHKTVDQVVVQPIRDAVNEVTDKISSGINAAVDKVKSAIAQGTPDAGAFEEVDGGLAGSAENGQGAENRVNTEADNIELDEFTSGAGPKHPAGQVGAIIRAGAKAGKAVAKQLIQSGSKSTLPGDTVQCPTCNGAIIQDSSGNNIHPGRTVNVPNPSKYPKYNPEKN